VIRTTRDRRIVALLRGEPPKGFPASLARAARRKLAQIESAERIEDLRIPPGNRLEMLRSEQSGRHSVRINDQWRFCFVWQSGDAFDVESVGLRDAAMTSETIHREGFDEVDLRATVESKAARLSPLHPGEVLRHDFLEPMGLSANMLALALRVPANRITAILHGTRAISGDTALRLARHFGTTPGFWLNLQKNYELELAERKHGSRIRAEVIPRAA